MRQDCHLRTFKLVPESCVSYRLQPAEKPPLHQKIGLIVFKFERIHDITPAWPHSTPRRKERGSLTLVRISASPCPYPLSEPHQRDPGPSLPPQNWMQREVGQREVGQSEVGHRGRWDTEGGGTQREVGQREVGHR